MRFGCVGGWAGSVTHKEEWKILGEGASDSFKLNPGLLKTQQIRGTSRQSAPEIRTWAFQFLFSVSERCKDGFSVACISLGRAGCINCLPLHNKLVHSLKAGNNKHVRHESLRTGNSEVVYRGGSHP